ncbi:MAG: DNA replication and repair protein RecF [candidate division Zixibacteria bacterium]|nr:DNA replication and repair protein RecF [candidate division Zixibacteria bacterium]
MRSQTCRNYRRDRRPKKKIDITIRIASSGARKIVVNGHRTIKQNELVGTSPTVFVLPEDIALTSEASSFHRQFLDLYISQYSHRYLDDLISYRKILLQRNKLLKDILKSAGKISQLDAWDQLLVEHGTRIIADRLSFTRSIADPAEEYYSRFDSSSQFSLAYKPKIEQDQEDIETAMKIQLENYRDREFRAGLTLVGPHRDRLAMNLNGKSVRHYGSRGQKRCVMLAMKLAVADLLSEVKQEQVTLILDEVFAELDSVKSQALMDVLSGYGQVFMATAGEFDFGDIPIRRVHVENGKTSDGSTA